MYGTYSTLSTGKGPLRAHQNSPLCIIKYRDRQLDNDSKNQLESLRRFFLCIITTRHMTE